MDLNPHQIEAALFALESPLSKGVILADEVGLGKTKDYEFQLIYVNGDNNLENLKALADTWKVRLLEKDFQRLMFDAEDA